MRLVADDDEVAGEALLTQARGNLTSAVAGADNDKDL